MLKTETNREFDNCYFRGLLQGNLAQLREIEQLKRAAKRLEEEVQYLGQIVTMGTEEMKKMKITQMNLEKENERLREKLKRLELDGSQANEKDGSQPKKAEERRDNTPEPEEVNRVSANEFMAAVIKDIDIGELSSNGPWDEVLACDKFFEVDHEKFTTPGTQVYDLTDYGIVYAVHPELCPHALYKECLTEYSKRRGRPKEINASLSPIISEVWVELPFQEHALENLYESFQGKVPKEDLKKIIMAIIPPPKMTSRTTDDIFDTHLTIPSHSGTRGAAKSRSSMAKVFVPQDTTFCGVVFAELDVSELADDDVVSIDFYPGVVLGLSMSHYKLHDLKVPHCWVDFFNGDSEDVLLSDLIPLEAIPTGTGLNLRQDDGTRECIIFETFEIRRDLERPAMCDCYIRGKVGDKVLSVPLQDVGIRGDTSYGLLKELRAKLFRRNQTNIYSENILPEGTKRARAARFKGTPAKKAKKPRLEKKKASAQIGFRASRNV